MNGNHFEVLGLDNNLVPHNSSANSGNGTNFGETQIVTDPVERTFTIQNTGSNTINLTGSPLIVITGDTDFTVSQDPSSSITKNNATTFKILFNPSSIGLKLLKFQFQAITTIIILIYLTSKVLESKLFDSDGDGIFDNVDIDMTMMALETILKNQIVMQ